MTTVSRQPGAVHPSPAPTYLRPVPTPPDAPSVEQDQLRKLLSMANRAIAAAERAANIAADETGQDVARILDQHGWPRLDDARKALEEAFSVAFEILDEAATALDKQQS